MTSKTKGSHLVHDDYEGQLGFVEDAVQRETRAIVIKHLTELKSPGCKREC